MHVKPGSVIGRMQVRGSSAKIASYCGLITLYVHPVLVVEILKM